MSPKKAISLCLALLLSLGLLAGCASQTPSAPPTPSVSGTPDAPSQSPEASTEPVQSDVTLTVAASQNWIKDVDRQLAEAFTAKTGIKIDFQVNPDDQYTNIIQSKLNTGDAPDIIMTRGGANLIKFNPSKYFVDLSGESWAPRMKEWAKTSGSVDGKLYAMNIWGADVTNGVYYQPKMFEQYNIKVPTNYAEFKTACDTLKANGVTPVYEFPKDLWHNHYWMEGVSLKALESDPQLYDKLNRNEIGFADVPEYVTAISQLKEMNDSGYFGETLMSNTYDGSYEGLYSNKYGMIIIHSSWNNEVLGKFADSDAAEWKMFPDPLADNQATTTTAGGIVKGINASGKNIDACKQYLNFLAEVENLNAFYQARADLIETSFTDVSTTPTSGYESATAISGDKIGLGAEAIVLFYDGSKIDELLQLMYTGQLKPEDVLKEFDTYRRSLGKDAGFAGF